MTLRVAGGPVRTRRRMAGYNRDQGAMLLAAVQEVARRVGGSILETTDALGGGFQDTSGITLPALNSPIGLLIDTSCGAPTLGPEDFLPSSISNTWTPNGSGKWTKTTAAWGGIGEHVNTRPLKQYTQYKVSVTASGDCSGGLKLWTGRDLSGSNNQAIWTTTVAGTFEFVISTLAGGLWFDLASAGPVIEKISFKEIIEPATIFGPSLISNGDFSSGTAGWSSQGGGVLAAVGGELEVSTGGASSYPGAYIDIQTEPGKRYLVDLVSRRGTSSSATALAISDAQGTISGLQINTEIYKQRFRQIFTARESTTKIIPHLSGAPAGAGTGYFDAISVRKLNGAIASQPTVASRPTLSRVPRKLGPELIVNGDFSQDTAWTKIGAGTTTIQISGGEMTVNAGGAWPGGRQVVPTRPGATYRVQHTARRGTTTSPTVASFNGVGVGSTTNTDPTVLVAYATVNSTASNMDLLISSATPTGTAIFDNVSVREVLEWSYSVQLDGVDDVLIGPSASAPAGETLIVANIWGPPPASYAPPAGRRSQNTGLMLRQSSNGDLAGFAMTGSSAQFVSFPRPQVGEATVHEILAESGNSSFYKNGALVGSLTSPYQSADSTVPLGMGSEKGGGASYFFGGPVAFVFWSPNRLSDSDRRTVGSYAAWKLGVPYA